jgi:hypothetical protein
VWRSNSFARNPILGSLELISQFSYSDLLDNWSLLRPAKEEEALAACVAELSPP